jgi:integrase
MQRERLTLPRIAAFTCPPGKQQAFLWDTEAPRLAVRVTANWKPSQAGKSFVFEGKLNRKTIRRTIGDVRNWSIEDARAEARRLQTLLDGNTDPRELERMAAEREAAAKAAEAAARQRAESRRRYTLRALCNAYADALAARGKAKSAAATRSAFKCHVFESFPDIADAPAGEVTSLQVAELVRKVREAGKERAAGILRSYLSAAFNAAKKAPFDASLSSDLIPFGIEHNPVDAIPAIAVKAGNRTLSAEELKAYVKALGDDVADKALKLALLSGGQRMAQLLRAKTSDFDVDTQTLRLWDAKGKRVTAREHLLPLAPRAASLVAELLKRAGEKDSTWLFSTHGKVAMTFTTPGKRVAEICNSMKCEPFDLRDIRRTCETMLASMGINRETRAQLLSHGISGVQATHYDRHGYMDEKRRALAAWEQRLELIETGKKTGNVRPLRRKTA